MHLGKRIACLCVGLALWACSPLHESPKYQFVDGWYKARLAGRKTGRVYVIVREDSIRAFPPGGKGQPVDTARSVTFAFLPVSATGLPHPYRFTRVSFDLDVLTIPFKYRPAVRELPNQFNSDFNGAMYLGYRSDLYKLTYISNPLRQYKRSVNHYGYSAGVFAGIGATPISPWVTRNQVAAEYSGVVFNKGVAGIIGLNNFSFGLSIGVDHLLDTNHEYWIYQGKPWLGLVIGLNLN